MSTINFIVFSVLIVSCFAQRPYYAGRRAIGYPAFEANTQGTLGNRFGDGNSTGTTGTAGTTGTNGTTGTPGTTQRLPVEARGDADLVNRLGKLPIDKQPFWLINWQALETHRKNPQTYAQKPNPFIDNPPAGPPPNQIPQTNQNRVF